jgi:DNA-binding transcriptional LysR family regulator
MMTSHISLLKLRTFREVMRAGSISAASRTLGRTQPAVSSVIVGLEAELGFSLFERERGRLVARPEARFLLEEAEAVLDRLAQATRAMAEIGRLEKGRLRLACHPAASAGFLPAIVASFLCDRPAVDLALMMRSSPVVDDLVASQEYDLGLAEMQAPRESVRRTAFDLECLLALPAAHPLAAFDTLTPRQLEDVPMATLYDGHPSFAATQDAFATAGSRLRRRFVLRTFLPALHLVGAGLCTCLCDPISATGYRDAGLVFRRFRPRIGAHVAILMPAHRAASLLANELRDRLAAELGQLTTWAPETG